ncbi:hypothetical protein [Romboutsia sp.]|uniref:hypothetical protein n=1 Tax=Romboutsia sp. TaxID=1965302 RepID=UPI002BFFCAA4|nr:hypothetical protein [Romboutsia sp.]HSQ90282.1 hypothetical protein [Romboutsia sp.]
MNNFISLLIDLEEINYRQSEDILFNLIENIKIQIVNKQYIDFLGGLYRLKEKL